MSQQDRRRPHRPDHVAGNRSHRSNDSSPSLTVNHQQESASHRLPSLRLAGDGRISDGSPTDLFAGDKPPSHHGQRTQNPIATRNTLDEINRGRHGAGSSARHGPPVPVAPPTPEHSRSSSRPVTATARRNYPATSEWGQVPPAQAPSRFPFFPASNSGETVWEDSDDDCMNPQNDDNVNPRDEGNEQKGAVIRGSGDTRNVAVLTEVSDAKKLPKPMRAHVVDPRADEGVAKATSWDEVKIDHPLSPPQGREDRGRHSVRPSGPESSHTSQRPEYGHSRHMTDDRRRGGYGDSYRGDPKERMGHYEGPHLRGGAYERDFPDKKTEDTQEESCCVLM